MPDALTFRPTQRGTAWKKPVLNRDIVDPVIIEMTTVTTKRPVRASWDQIAEALGISRNSVISRAKALGRHSPSILPKANTIEPSCIQSTRSTPTVADRAPLPAGHPVSWDMLVAGTTLNGLGYVYIPPPGLKKRPARTPPYEEKVICPEI